MASEAGKGSAQRPSQVPIEIVDENFERIFGKKPKKELTDQQKENEEIFDPFLTVNS